LCLQSFRKAPENKGVLLDASLPHCKAKHCFLLLLSAETKTADAVIFSEFQL